MGRPTTPLDLWRLAEQAERNGIRILREPFSNEHFATSGSDPTILHRLTHLSCSCRGFMVWQRCQHHALFLAQLGWLPDVADDEPEPDPSPAAPALPVPSRGRCPACDGRGTERLQAATGRWCTVHCLACRGTGEGRAVGRDAA